MLSPLNLFIGMLISASIYGTEPGNMSTGYVFCVIYLSISGFIINLYKGIKNV
jgi:hypothetical protein